MSDMKERAFAFLNPTVVALLSLTHRACIRKVFKIIWNAHTAQYTTFCVAVSSATYWSSHYTCTSTFVSESYMEYMAKNRVAYRYISC